ncbi:calcium:proton antiporter [Nakamurella endophytica]|uniref:Ionic transporter y4hA n=1 Tax=Nakamurella endophytica TaxID=1748367 RepID=A0A917T636_9ACTN|nr:ionic transporter y4hA [Nakamurella endophytica]GGM10595.1 ionic transporter y4hA [Nakamurella endophytica]
MASPARPLLTWTTVVPVVAIVVMVFTFGRELPVPLVVLVAVVLAGSVLAAVHHAEVVAHRVGEPFGSLVLAVAVTVIEVALIVTLTASGGEGAPELARDTVFAAVMITSNGIVGLSLMVASVRHGLAVFNAEGTGAALATVATLSGLTLVLPTFTTSRPGPEFSPAQLAFAAVASLLLYGAFVLTQTVRHRDFFLPVPVGAGASGPAGRPVHRTAAGDDAPAAEPGSEREVADRGDDEDDHAPPPTNRATLLSLALLLVSLVAVVGLAKVESPAIESGVAAVGFPQSFVGVVIALLVLAPETLAAVRAARRNRVQISMNLAYGSAMASIGLTIPVIAAASAWLDGPLNLGLGPTQLVLLVLTVAVSALTVVPGRATRLQAAVHLTLLAAFVFLAASP